ncbi:hypothetical protein D3C72_2123740 [compost metagenome]
MPASLKTSSPPFCWNSAIHAGTFTRWSTDCALEFSRAAHSMALAPFCSGCGTAKPMPSTVGQSLAQWSSPRSRSTCSAVWNMHWLDMTLPWRMSSAVRLLYIVTS